MKIIEPATGLEFYELSQPFGHDIPTVPGYADAQLIRPVTHAKHGVMAHRLKMVMHTSTHVNAPIHLIQGGLGAGDLDLQHFFGSGVAVDIPKDQWQLVTPEDLENAKLDIRPDDIVIINTGWHRRYSDSQEYFGYGPGLSEAAAQLLVSKGAKMVGVDTAFVDHPLATSMGPHRNGPQISRLPQHYKETTGRDAKEDYPDWNPAHRTLLGAGIPTLENVGADLDSVTGKRCTFQAYPWRWPEADACVVRLVAILDPAATYRLSSGETE